MARRGGRPKKRRGKSKGSSARGILKKIPLIHNPTFQKAAAGVGTVTIAAGILGLIGQGQIAANPIVRLGLAFAGGDIPGVAAQFFLGGGIGGNGGSLFGGGGGAVAGGA